MNTGDRVLAVVAIVLGAFVVVSEIPFWRSNSSLWPVLTALGLGLIALGAAHLLRGR